MNITCEEYQGGREMFFALHNDEEAKLGVNYLSSAFVEKKNFDENHWLMKELNHPTKPVVYFCDFVTDNRVRRKGYGRKLLQGVKKKYENHIIYLGVGCGSNRGMTRDMLIKFYESEGFKLMENNPCSYPIMAIEL
jgi:GNAT superfamily N-acetyltransferase